MIQKLDDSIEYPAQGQYEIKDINGSKFIKITTKYSNIKAMHIYLDIFEKTNDNYLESGQSYFIYSTLLNNIAYIDKNDRIRDLFLDEDYCITPHEQFGSITLNATIKNNDDIKYICVEREIARDQLINFSDPRLLSPIAAERQLNKQTLLIQDYAAAISRLPRERI